MKKYIKPVITVTNVSGSDYLLAGSVTMKGEVGDINTQFSKTNTEYQDTEASESLYDKRSIWDD